jgi:hypothetical protein
MDGLLCIAGEGRVLLYPCHSFTDQLCGTYTAQSGIVKDIIPLSGSRFLTGLGGENKQATDGVVLVQEEVISVYRILREERKLDLIFQFRDAISKLEFISASVDESRPWLVTLSSEAFNHRLHLELYDLNALRPKSASLFPLMRFDVSRLLNKRDTKDAIVRFVKQLSGLPAFVQSAYDEVSGHSVCILWESILKDQWYSFMPNFKVLNRNEPYTEREEEFDFNQDEDISTVRSTINRYKKASKELFFFIDLAFGLCLF